MTASSANVQVVQLADGREVCLSYGVVVAAFITAGYDTGYAPGCPRVAGYVRTDQKYSVTTSRHANTYAGRDSAIIPDATLRALVAPVADKHTRL